MLPLKFKFYENLSFVRWEKLLIFEAKSRLYLMNFSAIFVISFYLFKEAHIFGSLALKSFRHLFIQYLKKNWLFCWNYLRGVQLSIIRRRFTFRSAFLRDRLWITIGLLKREKCVVGGWVEGIVCHSG